MSKPAQFHWLTIFQALFVTLLWSSSWVLIKFGLEDIPALTFAGLRYTLAFLCLLPFALRRSSRQKLASLTTFQWRQLIVLGLVLYTLTQGAQFLGLFYLPAVTVSLILSFSPAVVALFSRPLLNEPLTSRQWWGIIIFLVGALIYFIPVAFPLQAWLGIGIVIVGMMANSGSALLGRAVNRALHLDAITVTTVSMGIGALILLGLGIGFQGMPELSLSHWTIIAWLAVVNTAFAFTLWNITLRSLTATESSIINNTMLIQIAILAWLFLGETLNYKEIIGLVFIVGGTLLVQLRGNPLKRT